MAMGLNSLTLALFASLLVSTLAGPTGPRTQCASECIPSRILNYEIGTTYTYDYSSETTPFLNENSISIDAKAHITPVSSCDFALTLSDVKIHGSDRSADFATEVTKNPLKFGFHDGEVTDVCGESTDPTWVINFKKGILTTFQNVVNTEKESKTISETSISGVCNVAYRYSKDNTVNKYSETSKCIHKPSSSNKMMAPVSYTTGSLINNVPLVDSYKSCENAMNEDLILTSAKCKETFFFTPLANTKSHTRAYVKTSLVLKDTNRGLVIPDFEMSRTALLFVLDKNVKSEENKIEMVQKILEELKVSIEKDIKSNVPALFSELVSEMKTLTHEQISQLVTMTKDTRVHKFLLDATPLVGTSSSMTVMSNLIQSGELSAIEVENWFTSLAFIGHPTKEMFTSLTPLMEKEQTTKAMLGVSSLIHNYCKINAACGDEVEVQGLLRIIESKLGTACRTVTKEDKVNVLVVLKALGNAGRWVNAGQILRRCYTEENPMDVRVAAIEAFRQVPCEYNREHLLSAFRDSELDSELRIAAYLSMMTCPSQQLIDAVKQQLTSEGVDQVGSFVWTHLTNLQESASPEKEEIRKLIGEDLLINKFKTESLKFSRNYETSFYSNVSEVGATVDSNVIFSSKSFLPRSAMLNLTVELFGENINLLEVGGRIEGFESFIEKFFGPNGYYPEETVAEIVKGLRQDKPLPETTLEEFLVKATNEPEASYYMKMFDNNMQYDHFYGGESMIKKAKSPCFMDMILEMARKGKVDYTKSKKLIDTVVTYPTISGLPLTLKINSTATIGVEIDGTFKAKSMKDIDINGHVHPSASIELESSIVVDAFVEKKGVKSVMNLHTSSFLDGKIKVEGGKLVDIAINIPKEKVELFDVKHDLFNLNGNEIVPREAAVSKTHKCISKFSHIIGGVVCLDLTLPTETLLAPFKASLVMEKEDTHTAYIFKYKKQPSGLLVMFDTPGSKVNRKFSLEMSGDRKSLDVNINTPFKTAHGTGSLEEIKNGMKFAANVEVDGNSYGVIYKTRNVGSYYNYEKVRSVNVYTPSGTLFKFNGKIGVNKEINKYDIDLSIDGFSPSPITLKGSTIGIVPENKIELEVASPWLDASLKTDYKLKIADLSYGIDLTYRLLKNPEEKFLNKLTFKKEYEGDILIQTSKFTLEHSSLDLGLTSIDLVSKIGNNMIDSTVAVKTKRNTYHFKETIEKESVSNNGFNYKLNGFFNDDKKYFDVVYQTSLLISNVEVKYNHDIKVAKCGSTRFELSWNKGTTINAVANIDIIDGFQVRDFSIKTLEDGYQVMGTFGKSLEGKIELNYKNKSSRNHVQLTGDYLFQTGNDYKYFGNGLIDVESRKAKFEWHMNTNDKNKKLILKAEPFALTIDSDIFMNVKLDAKLDVTGGEKKMNVEGILNNEHKLKLTGSVAVDHITADLSFNGIVAALHGKVSKDSVEMMLQWSPKDKIMMITKYSTEKPLLVEFSLDTPFTNWEKQTAMAKFDFNGKELNSQVSVNWSNTEQVSLLMKGMFDSFKKIDLDMSLTSSLKHMEKVQLVLHHALSQFIIDTNLEVTKGNQKLIGKINGSPSSKGYDLEASVTSPITRDFLLSFHHEREGVDMTSNLEVKIGTEVSTMLIDTKVNSPDFSDMNCHLLINTPLMSKVEANAKVLFSLSESKIDFEGKCGANKISLIADWSSVMNGNEKTYAGNMRFVAPRLVPFSLTFKHKIDVVNKKHFTTDFEMTRFWASQGVLKTHLEGKMENMSDIMLSGIVISPVMRSSIELKHLISNNNLNTKFTIVHNGDDIVLTAEGTVDQMSLIGNISGGLTSTYEGLDDIKMNFETTKTGTARVTKIILKKGSHMISLDHSIDVISLYKWFNSIKVNNKYSLETKFDLEKASRKLDFVNTYLWENKKVEMKMKIDKKVLVNIVNPWYPEITLKMSEEPQHVYLIDLLYDNDKEIVFTTTYDKSSEMQVSTLDTPYFDKLMFEYKLKEDKKFRLVYGENLLDTSFGWLVKPLAGNIYFTLKTVKFSWPVAVETNYDLRNKDKMITVTLLTNKKYEATVNFSLEHLKYQGSLDLKTPITNINVFAQTYLRGPKYSVMTKINVDNKLYSINGNLEENLMNLLIDFGGKKCDLHTTWALEENGFFNIQLKSTFEIVDNMQFRVNYDIPSKKADVKIIKGSHMISAFGGISDNSAMIEGTTSFNGWKTIKAEFTLEKKSMHVVLSRENRKIDMTANVDIKHAKGKADLKIETPYENFEKLTMNVNYEFGYGNKEFIFVSMLGNKKVELKTGAKIEHLLQPELYLTITTPFEKLESIKANAKLDFESKVKTVYVDSMINDESFNWMLELDATNMKLGKIHSKITSPVNGWTSFEITAKTDFTNMPYSISISTTKEGKKEIYSASLSYDNQKIMSEIQTPIMNWEKIIISGDYEKQGDNFNFAINMKKSSNNIKFNGDMILSLRNPKLNLNIETPFTSLRKINLNSNYEMKRDGLKSTVMLILEETKYLFNVDTSLDRKKGFFTTEIMWPKTAFENIKINGKYNFLSNIKSAEIALENMGVTKNLSLDMKLNNNEFEVKLNTFLDGFKNIILKGDYTKSYSKHSVFGNLKINENIEYKLDGMVHLKNKVFDVTIESPIHNIESVKIVGKIRDNKAEFEVQTKHQKYRYVAEYMLEEQSAHLKIKTPMRNLKNIAIGGKYSIEGNRGNCEAFVHINKEQFVLKANGDINKMASSFNVEIQSIKDNKKIGLNFNYDLLNEKKLAGVTVLINDSIKTVSLEGMYKINHGYLKIKTPFHGYLQTGVEYSMKLDKVQKTLDASVKFIKEEETYAFEVIGDLGENHLNIMFKSPFKQFEQMGVKGKMNFDEKFGKAIIDIGKLRFSVDVSYAMNNLAFKLMTPYKGYEKIFAKASYTWMENDKKAHISLGCNETVYELTSVFNIEPRKSELTIKGVTPFTEVGALSFSFKYNLDNAEELVFTELIAKDKVFTAKLGGYVKESELKVQFDMTSPIEGFTKVTFITNVDLTKEDKALEIVLKKEQNEKAIYLTGKLIGGAFDFNLITPFEGLKNLKTIATFSRAKRELSFQMMNDHHHASIGASFNSLHIVVHTPYEKAKEIVWDIKKGDDGVFEFHWKRNENYVDFKAVPQGKKKELELTMKSEIPGWQFLAMIGKLDSEEFSAYLSGQKNSEKMTISGDGHLGKKEGTISIVSHTPFDKYKTVNIDLKYNTKAKTVKFTAASDSSDFKIFFEKKRFIHGEVFIPNSERNTEVKIDLTPMNGLIEIHSRFPAVKHFKYEHHVKTANKIEVHASVELNDVKHFELDFEGPEQGGNTAHLEIVARRTGHTSKFHYERKGFESIEIGFERDGKHLKLNLKGSGSLPSNGKYELTTYNSFASVPRTIKAKVDFDRTSKPRTFLLDITFPGERHYNFDLKYNADIRNLKKGDYDLHITTPSNKSYHIKGDFERNKADRKIHFDFHLTTPTKKYDADGKIGRGEGEFHLKSDTKQNAFYAEWRIHKNAPQRDYYVKMGNDHHYFLFKLLGKIQDIANADIEAALHLPYVMKADFETTAKWHRNSDRSVSGEGDFKYGQYNGHHELKKFHRNAATRSADFEFVATTNIPRFNSFSIVGHYSFDHKADVDIKITHDGKSSHLKVNFTDLNSSFSSNKIEIHLPGGKDLEISVSHDIRNNMSKSASIVGKLGDRETSVRAKWSRNEKFTVLHGSVDFKSNLLNTEASLKLDYDVSDFNNAKAEIYYARNGGKNVSLKWERKRTDHSLHNEIEFTSHFTKVPNARFYVDAKYKKNVHIDAGLEYKNKKIHFELSVEKNKMKSVLHTPYAGFEEMTGELTYNLTDKKSKHVEFEYHRGSRTVHFKIDLMTPNKKSGELHAELHTPFDLLKEVKLDAKYENKKAHVNYIRNDVKYSFDGKADVKMSASAFDMTFTPPGGQPVHFKFEYDVKNFIAGTQNQKKNLAELDIEMFGKSFGFDVKGMRSQNHLELDIKTHSTFDGVSDVEIEIDSERKDNGNEVEFKVHVNEFHLEGDFLFERRSGNGYYVRCKIESSLTPLPALIFGMGRENDERIVTIGFGDDREVTISFKGKNNFKDGFSGFAKLPKRGLLNIKYDVDYKFNSDDELEIHLNIDYGDGRSLSAEAVYNSDGVKGRLSHPYYGKHYVRARRSISPKQFLADFALDDYKLELKGKYDNDASRRGFLLEGDIFGTPVKFDSLFYTEGSKYTEGKLIVETPYFSFNKLGGLFIWSNNNGKLNGEIEINLPSNITPKLQGSLNLNMNNGIHGKAVVDYSGQVYGVELNADKPLSKDAHVKLELKTPIHVIGQIIIEGNVHHKSLKDTSFDVNIEHPYGVASLMLKNKIAKANIKSELALDSSYHRIHFDTIVDLKRTPNGAKGEIFINKNKINFISEVSKSSFKLDIQTVLNFLEVSNKGFLIELKYPSKSDLEGKMSYINGVETHTLGAKIAYQMNKIAGNLEIESTLLKAPRKFNFLLKTSENFSKKFILDVSFETSVKHSTKVEFTRDNGVEVKVEADSHLFDKIVFDVKLIAKKLNIHWQKGSCVYDVIANYDYKFENQNLKNVEGNLKITCPTFNKKYELNGKLTFATNEKTILLSFHDNATEHKLECNYMLLDNEGKFVVAVKTPAFNIGDITYNLAFGYKKQLTFDSLLKHHGQTHTLDFNFDKNSQSFVANLNSPALEMKSAKVEAAIIGKTIDNMKVKLDTIFGDYPLSSKVILKVKSIEDMTTDVEIRTPIKGYKKITFGGSFKKENLSMFKIYATNPLNLKIEGEFGNKDDLFHSLVNIETPFEQFKNIKGVISLPLNKIAPKITFTFDDKTIGFEGEYIHRDFTHILHTTIETPEGKMTNDASLRYKGPYEYYNKATYGLFTSAFHLRTDSSFLSLFI